MAAGLESSLLAGITTGIDRVAYRAQQRGLALSAAALASLLRTIFAPGEQPPNREILTLLKSRFEQLLEDDLANVEAGHYPRRLLYQYPYLDYLMATPRLLLDIPRIAWRSARGGHDELPETIDRSAYPAYYLRTFHWQSDGWLSDHSAEIYDAGVELLFGGSADVMRRMAIPEVVRAVGEKKRPRILDLGCGTGRFLLQLSQALPGARLSGLDLSSFYLAKAARLLSSASGVSLLADNAEAIPSPGQHYDAVTSVFLFHELPPKVRRRVMAEAMRVLRPGGAFVVCDSMQRSDSPELSDVLDLFAGRYHEPYYKSYARDDLAALMSESGSEVESEGSHFVSKVVAGRRP